jgi:hypothetical protein
VADAKIEDSVLSPLAKASDRIRASAQYLLGAFAAVGATLAAGLQLADIGEVSFDEDALRAGLTFVGLAGAVVGIAVAIAAAADVSTQSHVSLPWLIANRTSPARDAVDSDAALRQGLSIEQLKDQIDAAVAAAADTYRQIVVFGDPGIDPAKVAEEKRMRTRHTQNTAALSQLKQVRSDVLDVASYYRIRSAYESAKGKIVRGAVAAALGLAAFAWGANPPDAPDLDPGGVMPKTPSEVTVILTDAGNSKFRDQLGSDCDTSRVSAIAFAVDHTTYDVVTEKTDQCASVELSITEKLGAVVPRIELGGVDAEPGQPLGD